MKDATLPAEAGIGSNDKDFLARAERVAKEGRTATAVMHRVQSGAIKSTAAYRGEGWREGVGPKFPDGV